MYKSYVEGKGKMKLSGKTALITGAGSGIGRATAMLFGREGGKVVVADVSSEKGNETVQMLKENGDQGMFLKVDVTKASEIENMVKAVIDRYKRIDILVNNAGFYDRGTVVTTTQEQWDRVIEINLKGVFLCSKMVVPEMKKKGGGVIINVASESGIVGERNSVAYNASKGAVVLLTKCMALDHVEDNIRVNCVCPGTTFTPLVEKALKEEDDPDEALEQLQTIRPIHRLGNPEEIAHAILYLASDESGYVIGSTLVIDGGYTAQ